MRAGFGVSPLRGRILSLVCVTLTLSACTATVDGTPTSAHNAQGTPLSPTSETSPAQTFTLPAELDGFDPFTDTKDLDTRALFTRVVVDVSAWSDALGTDIATPVAIPRSTETACLRDRLARACDTRIEYDVDQLQEDRDAFGDLPVRTVAAHEAGHFVVAAAGGDTASTVDDDAEARANCVAGAYLATDPAITAQSAGDAFMRTPLPQAGDGSYTAFRAGFTMIRNGENPISTCALMLG